jgi:hypothetical protein
MAIKDNNQNQQEPTAIADGFQRAHQAQPQRSNPELSNTPRLDAGNGSFSFHTGGLFSAPVAAGTGSEYYSKLKTALTEVYKQSNDAVEVILLDMENTVETALAYSCLVVAVRYKKAPELGVAFHTLLLEATGDVPSSYFEQIGNRQVEVIRVASDAFDEILVAKVNERVARAFPRVPTHLVDGSVIPTSFNPESREAVQKLALNAAVACTTELSVNSPDFQDLNLTKLVTDSILSVNITFNKQTVQDMVGVPARSDIAITLTSKKSANINNRNASLNSGDREIAVSQVNGFVDLMWNPLVPQNPLNPWTQQQNQPTQLYVPRLVITNMTGGYSYTPSSVLLALATSLTLRDDSAWVQAFRPSDTPDGAVDLSDIGALNFEANLAKSPTGFGERINTKDSKFTLQELGSLVGMLIQPGMMVSLDCPEVGASSWYLSLFAAAASGSQIARRGIIEAANHLTNGAFSRHYQQDNMFADENNRVHLGTWRDRNGNLRDIRDIDYLAVCNLVGDRNPAAIRDWSDTWLRTQQWPLAQRLEARKKMIQAFTNETAKFTGFAQRVTFSSYFFEALSRAIQETKLPVRVTTPLSSSEFSNQRGVASFANQAMLGTGQTFFNNPAMPGNFSQAGGNYFGRY